MALQRWSSWTLLIKRGHKVFFKDYSKVTGTIAQYLLPWLFNNAWQDSATVSGTIPHSHWHGLFFFLCLHNSSSMVFTVKKMCPVFGIPHIILQANPQKTINTNYKERINRWNSSSITDALCYRTTVINMNVSDK